MRTILKNRTDHAHRRVDDAYSALNLANRADYTMFLQAHHLAYRALLASFAENAWMHDITSEVINCLKADLRVLWARPVDPPIAGFHVPKRSAGAAYVICGSHFGKRVLLKRWSQSQDAALRAAGTYLQTPVLKEGWARLLTAFDQMQTDPLELHWQAEAAEKTFNLFHQSLVTAQLSQKEHAYGPT